jgi:DNA-binding LacI/PurR family transcriptional regulator
MLWPFDEGVTVMVKRVSLSDVARAAGVGKATASRALSGREEVGAATRARIRDIAADMGYQPHRVAQSLRTGRFGVLAISICPSDTRTGELLRVAALRSAELGYQLLVDVRASGDEAVALARFAGLAVDGVLVVGAAVRPDGQTLPHAVLPWPPVDPGAAAAEGVEGVVSQVG